MGRSPAGSPSTAVHLRMRRLRRRERSDAPPARSSKQIEPPRSVRQLRDQPYELPRSRRSPSSATMAKIMERWRRGRFFGADERRFSRRDGKSKGAAPFSRLREKMSAQPTDEGRACETTPRSAAATGDWKIKSAANESAAERECSRKERRTPCLPSSGASRHLLPRAGEGVQAAPPSPWRARAAAASSAAAAGRERVGRHAGSAPPAT